MPAIGSRIYLHTDSLRMPAWEQQLRGESRWTVCPGGAASAAASCGLGSIDPHDPSYERCAAFRNASCFEATLQPGDSLYVPSGWWMAASALSSAAASFGAKMLSKVDQPAIAAAVTAACEQGTLQSSRATLPQGGGLPLATGDAVTPLLETPPAGEAGERRKGSASWWARPSIDSVALCRAMSPCIEDWAAGESDPTAPPL